MAEWLESLGGLPPAAIYLLLAGLVAAETGLVVGLFLPGEPVLLFAGFLVSVGTLDLAPTIGVLVVAALVGDSLAFTLGRRYGPRVRAARLGRWIGEERWQRAERLLVRHGGRAVFLGRWVAFARTLLPSLAGMSGMRYRRFLIWDLAAVGTYVPGSVLLGYGAGRSYLELERTLGRATGAVMLLAVGVAGLVLAGRWLGRRPDPARALGRYLNELAPVRLAWSSHDWYSTRLGAAGARTVNVAFGVGAMFLLGWGVAELARRVVRTSGLPVVDQRVVRWIAARADPEVTDAARVVVTTIRGFTAVIVVGLVAVVVALRSRRRGEPRWFAPLGAFGSLVILGATVDWAIPGTTPPPGQPPDAFFPTSHVIVTASLGLLAWMASRHSNWSRSVGAWTGAAIVLFLVTVARLYLVDNWPSEAAAAVLLGVVWDVVLVATWRSWERAPEAAARPAPAAANR